MIEEILKDKRMPIYSVEYELAGRISVADREAMLNHFGQGSPNSPLLRGRVEDNGYIPQYIRELYAKTFAPRLRGEDGTRLSIAQTAQRLNMITFVNHCQGSTVSFQLERLLAEDLKSLGHSEKVQNYLLKQVHNVDVAPVIPYGITQTTTFKFASFADEKVTSVRTPQSEYILQRKREHERFMAGINGNHAARTAGHRPFTMNFSLFRPTGNETVFAVNNMYPVEVQKDEDFDGIEHTFDSYSDKDDDYRTKQGDQLSQAFHEVVNWLAEHSKKIKSPDRTSRHLQRAAFFAHHRPRPKQPLRFYHQRNRHNESPPRQTGTPATAFSLPNHSRRPVPAPRQFPLSCFPAVYSLRPLPILYSFAPSPPRIFFHLSAHIKKRHLPMPPLKYVLSPTCACQTGKQAFFCNQAAVRQNAAIKTERRRQLRRFRQPAYYPIPKPPKSRKYRPHRPERRRRRGRQA